MAGNGDHLILCAECDHNSIHVILEDWANGDFDRDKEKQCVVQWLTGQLLTNDDDGQSTACDCFQSDPFPAAEWPEMKNNNRRYFYYRALAKKLGATGRHTRAKLPVAACLVKRIAQMYPDARGAATKVRFRKRAREEEGKTAVACSQCVVHTLDRTLEPPTDPPLLL